ncbi:MAG: hypothetical protein ACREJD_15930 [Phycisphaerales bacterium]
MAETQSDPTEIAKQFLLAVQHAESFCDQDPHDKVGEDLLVAATIRCDQLLSNPNLDGAILAQIREANERIKARLSVPRRTGQP